MKNIQRIIERTLEHRTASPVDPLSEQVLEDAKLSLPERIDAAYDIIGKLGATAAQMMAMSSLNALETRHPKHGIFGLGRVATSMGGHHDTHWVVIWIVEVNGEDKHQNLIFDAETKKAFHPAVPEGEKLPEGFNPQVGIHQIGLVAKEILEWLILEEDSDALVRTRGVSMSHDRLGERILVDRMASWFAACSPERSFHVGIDQLSPQDRMMFKNSERRGWIDIELGEDIPKVAQVTWTDTGLKQLTKLFLS